MVAIVANATASTGNYAFGPFVKPMSDSLGWSRTSISWASHDGWGDRTRIRSDAHIRSERALAVLPPAWHCLWTRNLDSLVKTRFEEVPAI